MAPIKNDPALAQLLLGGGSRSAPSALLVALVPSLPRPH